MDNTIIQQGSFTSDGAAKYIALRSDVDWMRVYNYTASAGATSGDGCIYYWQRGMAQGTGLYEYHPAADQTLAINALAATTGFYWFDTSDTTPSARTALTAMTAANPPVITTAATPVVGDIVRLSNLDNQPQFGGIDFSVSAAAAGANFTIGNISSTNSVASTAGYWRLIPYDHIFYPRNRTISYIAPGATTKIYLTVTHGFTVGQKVRLSFPGGTALWGDYYSLHDQVVTITGLDVARAGNEPTNAAGDNNIIVDFDSTGYTAWEATFGAAGNEYYPAVGDVPFTPAQVVPVGMDTSAAIIGGLDILSDAKYNTAYIGMKLMPGVAGPAGDTSDVMYWVAGKSFSNLAE